MEYIPTIYALTNKGHKVYIISPWINSEVKLRRSWKYPTEEISLFHLIEDERKNGVITEIFISSMGSSETKTDKSIKKFESNNIKVTEVKGLHSKAIIGQNLMYEGSANITYGGLYSNKESGILIPVENQSVALRRVLT